MFLIIGLLIFFILLSIFLFIYGKHKDKDVLPYTIVLGAGLYGDKISSALKRRLDATYEYTKMNDSIIIVCGGQGKHETITEAQAMYQYLVKRGIDSKRIRLENKSTSTYQNIMYAKNYILDNQKEVMIVTCDFHMYRSKAIAKTLGLKAFGYPAKSEGLKVIRYYLRECLCVIKFWIIKK